jgi:hypothetical protein
MRERTFDVTVTLEWATGVGELQRYASRVPCNLGKQAQMCGG